MYMYIYVWVTVRQIDRQTDKLRQVTDNIISQVAFPNIAWDEILPFGTIGYLKFNIIFFMYYVDNTFYDFL